MINFDLTDEILKAAEAVKEEEGLRGDRDAIASVIFNWLSAQLDDILWENARRASLQRGISKVEQQQEQQQQEAA